MALVGSLALALLSTLVGLSAVHSAPAPGPAAVADCSGVLLSLAECLSYVSAGSTDRKPTTGCCNGLKSVLQQPGASTTGVPCLCDAFKNGQTEYAVNLSMTRAVDMPRACNVKFSIKDSCHIGSAPAPAPVPAHSPPATSPSPSVPGTPSALIPGTPSSSTGAAGEAPSAQASSSPGSSGEAPSAQAPDSPGSSSSSLASSVASLVLTAIAVVLLT